MTASQPPLQSISDILSAAAVLITPEGAWVQTTLARDANGQRVSPLSDEATCWCATGAVIRVLGTTDFDFRPYSRLILPDEGEYSNVAKESGL